MRKCIQEGNNYLKFYLNYKFHKYGDQLFELVVKPTGVCNQVKKKSMDGLDLMRINGWISVKLGDILKKNLTFVLQEESLTKPK